MNTFFQFCFGMFPKYLPNIPEYYCTFNLYLVLPSDVHDSEQSPHSVKDSSLQFHSLEP